tara:strand:+ start:24352 stop:24684 length:333 start_codon:yes stop_codon:yes gene_type:complete
MAIKTKGKVASTPVASKAEKKVFNQGLSAMEKKMLAQIAALESKIASMESAMVAQAKASEEVHAELKAECKAMCQSNVSSNGKDEDLRKELKRHFDTAATHKHKTYFPKL